MKKVLPIIILFLGIAVALGAYLFIKGNDKQKEDNGSDTEEVVPEIALEKRPVVSLIPSEDGHWLKFEIKKILIDAATLDYEMTYKVPDGRTQGVPGTVKLTSEEDIEKDLLLGSESSGKFRYDEGVERGNVVLRFRDDNGKLVAKFETEFTLQTGSNEISCPIGIYTLDEINKGAFFVTMDTIGYPGEPSVDPKQTFGIFSSLAKGNSGKFEDGETYFYEDDGWMKLEDGKTSGVGFFLLSS